MTFTPNGHLYHTNKVDPHRPIDLSLPRNLIDHLGRPVRGVANHYNYAPEERELALADYRAAKRLKLKPLLRDFSAHLATGAAVEVLGK